MAKTKNHRRKAAGTSRTDAAASSGRAASQQRVHVAKTYKLYIQGRFPRSESGRYVNLSDRQGRPVASLCRASRKDFREAVLAARKAQPAWAAASGYLRGQILYRIAEMLEGRKSQFIDELMLTGATAAHAAAEVRRSVDRLVYYAGWCDKYPQLFSTVNPVSESYFNFSLPEPTGVVSILAPEESGLIGLVSVVAPAIAGGNTCVVLASSRHPVCAITFAEVLHSSDVPGGVVNILTGFRTELLEHFSGHMDVNACVYCGEDPSERKAVQVNASLNVKRVVAYRDTNWMESGEAVQNPYRIQDLQEIKTTWHPVGT
jgi:acyl-CoA reductase-like NAD-dependent aldehyde dehydrogenase